MKRRGRHDKYDGEGDESHRCEVTRRLKCVSVSNRSLNTAIIGIRTRAECRQHHARSSTAVSVLIFQGFALSPFSIAKSRPLQGSLHERPHRSVRSMHRKTCHMEGRHRVCLVKVRFGSEIRSEEYWSIDCGHRYLADPARLAWVYGSVQIARCLTSAPVGHSIVTARKPALLSPVKVTLDGRLGQNEFRLRGGPMLFVSRPRESLAELTPRAWPFIFSAPAFAYVAQRIGCLRAYPS